MMQEARTLDFGVQEELVLFALEDLIYISAAAVVSACHVKVWVPG